MKKRFLGVIIAMVMVIGLVPSFVIAAFAVDAADDITVTIDTGASVTLKDADGDGYYDIGTADELYAFAAAVNMGNLELNGELTAYIIVNEHLTLSDNDVKNGSYRCWVPIGNNFNYDGVFDGNGMIVKGLYFNDASISSIGLIGQLGTNGEVKNVFVIDSYFNAASCVGSAVGINYGTVTNCGSTSLVQGNDNYFGWIVGGGSSGDSPYDEKEFCESGASIGGVVGENYGTVSGCYGKGYVKNNYYVGGVVGWNGGTVTKCYNEGYVDGINYVGGVVGQTDHGSVSYCYNTGIVTATSSRGYVGGVVGYLNNGGILASSYHMGRTTGAPTVKYVEDGCTVERCYYLASAENDNDGVNVTEEKTAAQFSSGEVAFLLGNNFGQTIEGNSRQNHPVIGGKPVYYGYRDCHEEKVYSNKDDLSQTKSDHRFVRNKCEVCDHHCVYESNVAASCTVCGRVRYAVSLGNEWFYEDALTRSDSKGGTATYDPDTKTLTLHNYTYEGEGYHVSNSDGFALIYSEYDLKLVLVGENMLIGNTSELSFGIYTSAAHDLHVSGSGSLLINGISFINSKGVYCHDFLLETATLIITSMDFGISPANSFTMNSGTLDLTVKSTSIDCSYGVMTIAGGTYYNRSGNYAFLGGEGSKITGGCINSYMLGLKNSIEDLLPAGYVLTQFREGSNMVYLVDKIYPVYVGGVGMEDGDYLPSGNDKTRADISKSKPSNGGYAYYQNGILTLHNYTYEGTGYYHGDTYVFCGIYVTVDTLTIRLDEGTVNRISILPNGETYAILTWNANGEAPNSAGDLTIEGKGSLSLDGWAESDSYGINCGMLTVTDGALEIKEFQYGLSAKKDVSISGTNTKIHIFDCRRAINVLGTLEIGDYDCFVGTVATVASDALHLPEHQVQTFLDSNGAVASDVYIANHTGGTATCTARARCERCDKEYGEILNHTHGTEFKNDAANHWNECACGDKTKVASHADTNNDASCDTCGYAMPLAPSTSGENGTNEGNTNNGNTGENEGLGAGAIVGIAAGSVAILGLGGFSLFWFVIKKKSFPT